ncbi:ComEC/Rec2 family competence protein [Patescibacteria group bacterium]
MKKLVMTAVLSFAVGVFAGSFVDFSVELGFLFVFLSLATLTLHFLKLPKSDFGSLTIVVLVLFALGAGLVWFGHRAIPPDISYLSSNVGERISVTGIVVDEPDTREKYARYVLKVNEAKILIYGEHYPEYKYGDEIEAKGLLKKPEKFSEDPSTSSGQAFDWPAYLAKDDIYFEMFYPETEWVSEGNGNIIKEKLFALKNAFLSNISRVIPEPQSSLLGGLVFGAKRSMPPELLEDFRETGIIHIVVLSGYNITIVADAIMRVFSFFPQMLGISLGIIGIIFFALMTGASATIIRASIMAVFVLIARATGRIYQVTIALFIAGFFMILWNPKIVRFDSSFQLSFLATLALIYVAPLLEPYLKFFPKRWKIREFATATIATQIFVLPLLLYKMGLLSLVSIPVNLLILIFVPATMFFGFATACVGFVSTLIAAPLAWVTYVLLSYQLKVVELFASLPFASVSISYFPLWIMLSFYLTYVIVMHKLQKKLKKAERPGIKEEGGKIAEK